MILPLCICRKLKIVPEQIQLEFVSAAPFASVAGGVSTMAEQPDHHAESIYCLIMDGRGSIKKTSNVSFSVC